MEGVVILGLLIHMILLSYLTEEQPQFHWQAGRFSMPAQLERVISEQPQPKLRHFLLFFLHPVNIYLFKKQVVRSVWRYLPLM